VTTPIRVPISRSNRHRPWASWFTLIAALAITGVMQLMARAVQDGSRDSSHGHGRWRSATRACGWRTSSRRVRPRYGLAGVAGTLISLSYAAEPSMGDPFLIKAFVVCVPGRTRIGPGCVDRRLGLGIIEAFATQLDVTIGTQHISGSGLQDAIALVVLLIVADVRPRESWDGPRRPSPRRRRRCAAPGWRHHREARWVCGRPGCVALLLACRSRTTAISQRVSEHSDVRPRWPTAGT